MFTPLNFPKTALNLTKKEGKVYVWDEFRKKKLLLTPEEWVRQHVLHYLVEHKNVPLSLIASEYAIKVNKMTRRCDGVVFDKTANPIMIIECKAPAIKLTEKVLQQIAQYNYQLRVDWLICTNGIETIVAKIDKAEGTISYQKEVPTYLEMQDN